MSAKLLFKRKLVKSYVPVFIKKRMFGHTFSVYVPPSSVSGTFYFPFSTYVPRLSFPGTFYFSISTYVQNSPKKL